MGDPQKRIALLFSLYPLFLFERKRDKKKQQACGLTAGAVSSCVLFASSLAAYLPAYGRKGRSRQLSGRRGRVR
jgi:hypothetical protein